MNLDRTQRRYVFHGPSYRPWLAPALAWFSRNVVGRRHFKVRRIEIAGLESVASLAGSGASVLIAPNHADHADPHVLLHCAARARTHFQFISAREGFERGRLAAFLLGSLGCFSIDRDGADLAALRTAIRALTDARWPLVVFPEGEIYHHQSDLDQLNEGVATIALRAAAKLPDPQRCHLAARIRAMLPSAPDPAGSPGPPRAAP